MTLVPTLVSTAFAACAAFTGTACAQARLQPAQSEITFTTRQMGVPVDGRFTRFAARIALDPRQPAAGSVGIDIDTASARFGAAETEAEVAKPDWLASARHPQATFRSSAIKPAGAGRYDVTGTLSIKGQARNVVVPVQLTQAGAASTASGSFTIKRLDFQVGAGDWADTSIVADDVVVRFRLTFTGIAPL